MIIAGKYEIPDSCPPDCVLRDELANFGQSATCCRCPVLNCSLNEPAPEIGYQESWRMLEPEEFREDWAKVWCSFFKGEVGFPILCL